MRPGGVSQSPVERAEADSSVWRPGWSKSLAVVFASAVLLGTAGCSDSGSGAGPGSSRTSSATPPTITLAFAGDVHFAGRTLALLDNPDTAFGPIAKDLSAADVSVVNLETAVTDGGTPEPKQFHFRAPASTYQAVKAAGVDAVSLANNHAMDYGADGLSDTIRHASDAEVPVFGVGQDADAAYAPWITEVKGIKVAVLGLSQIRELSERWTAGAGKPGVAMAHDVDRAARAVRDAKQQADVVITFLHWGEEGNECPTERMTTLAKALADAGATAIIGTHAHLLQGDGWLGDTYVAYGLGNFLWWRDDAYSNDTGITNLTLKGTSLESATFVPARISDTGQPLVAEGAEATRITDKYAALRECTGLADAP
ncbi:MAG: CapA family protein [Micromonosporaceae bacterium]